MIFVLEDNIKKCIEKSGSEDFILLEHIKEEFDTPVWIKMLGDEDSFFSRLLQSEDFKA